ncbi:EAL domain-containing protein [Vibrio jasicida]|uniref:EAL domain-containing protein n=1 Tax=Vibrio jasicida TaxID=766224 RepID=UPI0015E28704|nr:EAL domain-containing protein [Vibrio jasicida]
MMTKSCEYLRSYYDKNDLSRCDIFLVSQAIVDGRSNKCVKEEILCRFVSSLGIHLNTEEAIKSVISFGEINMYTIKILNNILALVNSGVLSNKKHISVNLEPESLSNCIIVDMLLLLGSKIRLTLELTERSPITYNKELIRELKGCGISISLDDFGIGYSGLLHLIDLPVDEIKIDKIIISKIHGCIKSKKIIKNIKNLADDLDLTVIAEGVETKRQSEWLNDCGIYLHQGFYHSSPKGFEVTYG